LPRQDIARKKAHLLVGALQGDAQLVLSTLRTRWAEQIQLDQVVE
jgi:hypothetical protein